MILDKKASLKLVHKRLDELTKALNDLDALSKKRIDQQAELDAINASEANLLAQESGETEEKLSTLLQIRGKKDIQAAAVARTDTRIALAQEVVSNRGVTAAQVVYAFKLSAIEQYFQGVKARAAEYFDKQDFNLLKDLAGKTEKARSLTGVGEFSFSPLSLQHREFDIDQARRIGVTFAQLEKDASSLDVAIDIPPDRAE